MLLSAGNLATTQAVVKRLWSDIEEAAPVNLRSVPSMLAASDYIASISASVQKQHTERDTANTNFEATFIFGGQVGSGRPETLLIYAQGNYIHESDDHPFLQIGEMKYGKPILAATTNVEPHSGGPPTARAVAHNPTPPPHPPAGPPLICSSSGKMLSISVSA
ncbi:MAG: hypothetical protein IPM27_03890 [Nitrosomonadales bacterium]|nr:hypothetical protein [Nitrosomonadales bacterium]